jgi:hypothetical protein
MSTSAHVSSWLIAVLRQLHQRPAMYLFDDRIVSLACYITGIFSGRKGVGVSDADEEAFMTAFGEWLQVGAGIEAPPPSDCWFFLICYYPERTGRAEDFYRELDRYLQELGFAYGLADERFDLSTWRDAQEQRRGGGRD